VIYPVDAFGGALGFLSKDHKGFDHVIPTVVCGGKAVPFTDWTMVSPK
jgi:hypothetical protein